VSNFEVPRLSTYPILLFLFGMVAWAVVPLSPRIEALRKAVHGHEPGAVEAFWNVVTKIGGTPLVECPPTLAPNCLVTFLWRGDASTRNALVFSEALPGKPAKHLFRHLSGTNVWYRTYTFRDDARFMYMLSINDPLTPWEVEGSERKKRYAGVRTDPLNQRNWCYVSLPRAPSERWVEERPGIPHGEIRRHKLPSTVLSGEREVEIYVTPNFQSGGPRITPVLILFDGEESKVLGKVPAILDNLFVEGRLPSLLAVFLIQPHERREADLVCSQATNRFLSHELLPWLRGEYKIRTAAPRTIVAGASLGGLAASYAALEQPKVFGRVLSQSGSFGWGKRDAEAEWLTAEFRSRPRVNAKFYLDVGIMETKGGARSQLKTNRRFRDALRRKGYHVTYREFNGAHDFPCWRANFADALVALLSEP
jgi:enterochelin esterase family protein